MKRTSVMLPDGVLARLRHESRRRGTSVAEIVREAVERHLPEPEPGRRLSFFGIVEDGPSDGAMRVEEDVGAEVERRLAERG